MNPNNFSSAKLLSTQPKQTPDDVLAGPAFTSNAFACMPTGDAEVRLVFTEQVFQDGRQHFRTAVQLPRKTFLLLVKSLNEVEKQLLELK